MEELSPKENNSPEKSQAFLKKLSEKWTSLSPEKRIYFTQLGLTAAVQAVDVLTTHVALQTVPGATEVNPIAKYLIDNGGTAVLLLTKMGFASAQIIGYEVTRRTLGKGDYDPSYNRIIRIGNSLMTALCVNNALHILMSR